MCVRTKLNEKKLYINFFSWNKIPAPKTDDDPIPVYGKEIIPRNDDSSLVNIAFSKTILDKYGYNAHNVQERDMLIELAFKYIEEQNKVDLNHNGFIIIEECYGDEKECILNLNNNKDINQNEIEMAKEALNAIKLKSNENDQETLNKLSDNILKDLKIGDSNINVDKKVLIEEVNEIAEPSFESKLNEETLENIFYEIKISLPKVKSFSECDLNIENDYITLDVNKGYYKQLKISLKDLLIKYDILNDEIEAKFVKKLSILKIKIPLILK
jgi:hypothetical protein